MEAFFTFKTLLGYFFIANLVVNALAVNTITRFFNCGSTWVQFKETGEIWAVFIVVPMYLYRVNSSLC